MWLYAARRVLMTIPICLGVTVLCFLLVYLAPGNPVQNLLPPGATAQDVMALKHAYGLDKPIPVQYVIWLGHALTGNLGLSIQTNRPVIFEVLRALRNTVPIAVISCILATVIAMILGLLAATRIGSVIDRMATAVAMLGLSVPSFWLGVMLVIYFSVEHNWLPATGMGSNGSSQFSWFVWSQAKYAVLPIIALTVTPLGIMMRTIRSAVAEVLALDFVNTLRAKGLGRRQIIVHAVRNALAQILAMFGLQLGYLIGGSILVETVFTWPGTGYLLNRAVLSRDIPLLQGTILVLAISFVLINLIVDLLQTVVDPRIKRS
jgi:peptide/nickel transport system permease protein